MKYTYLATTLISSLVIGLVAEARYAPLAREVPRVLAASDPAAGIGALPSQAWVGPSLLIPGVALVLGIVAGWLATRGDAIERSAGARAGAAAGFGALAAAAIVFTAMVAAIARDPAVQAFVQLSEPHPEARLSSETIPWVGAGIGLLLGLFIGAESMATALFGGVLVDVLRGRGASAGIHPVH